MDLEEGSATVVVLTAIEAEYAAVRAHLSQLRQRIHEAGTLFEVGRLPGEAGTVAIGVTGVGNREAAVLAERAINMFRPAALLFAGVAGALDEDLALGDVVVATRVYAVHGGKEQSDGFGARPVSWPASHELEHLARHIFRTSSWHHLLQPGKPPPRVHFKPIAAGEVVLNSRTTPLAQQLRHVYNDAAAIEMESAGVAHAGYVNRSLPVLTIRGISDKADGTKRADDQGGWQPRSAAHAAAFAIAVAAEIVDRRESPAAGAGPVRSGTSQRPGKLPRLMATRPETGGFVGKMRILGIAASIAVLAALASSAGGPVTSGRSSWPGYELVHDRELLKVSPPAWCGRTLIDFDRLEAKRVEPAHPKESGTDLVYDACGGDGLTTKYAGATAVGFGPAGVRSPQSCAQSAHQLGLSDGEPISNFPVGAVLCVVTSQAAVAWIDVVKVGEPYGKDDGEPKPTLNLLVTVWRPTGSPAQPIRQAMRNLVDFVSAYDGA